MVQRKTTLIPLLPLDQGTIFLPGVNHRISATGRSDVAALLSHIYGRVSTPTSSPVTIGCIPLRSAYLSKDGRRLITDNDRVASGGREGTKERVIDVNDAREQDLFRYGVLAQVLGVQGKSRGEVSLMVEGLKRFEVREVVQARPYFEAKVTLLEDEAVSNSDTVMQSLYSELRRVSHELFTLTRLSFLIPRALKTSMSPLLARRLDVFIAKKGIQDAGLVADILCNAIDCTFEDKARALATVKVKERVELALEIVQRLVADVKGDGRVTTLTTTSTTKESPVMDMEQLQKLQQELLLSKLGGQMAGKSGKLPKLLGGGGGGGIGLGGEEPNELDELKKRLEDARLSADAEKVAKREMQRLQKMNPAQAEYQVCRNYLETLAEIPWSKFTEDKLEAATLQRARMQLDDDHYGLDDIKKRLLEYLAVLRLKQNVTAQLDERIAELSGESTAKARGANEKDPSDLNKDQIAERERLIEKKRMLDKSPILLLVGPPGTGKTSLAKSIAAALGRKFHRISLGGVRDEAEIRGHRRTYVAAMPGLIISGLKKVGAGNPVFLLDEIDKVGTSNFHGDPSAAMLEVLDPEQNHTFTDHYLNIPFDLSKVLFIATANTLDSIPPPLLDRMETISLSGYTTLEKRHIAARHLLPKQITTNGLASDAIKVSDEILDKIITGYTREAGVRSLEREIAAVCRAKAVEYSESLDFPENTPTDSSITSPHTNNSKTDTDENDGAHYHSSSIDKSPKPYSPQVHLADLERILGPERYDFELAATSTRPGVVTGLVAYSTGAQGSILFIEISDYPTSSSSSSPSSSAITLTGQLGSVLQESVSVALTWVRAHALALGLTDSPDTDIMRNRALHVHCPAGAVPKDGPSAGLAHAVALISLFSGRPVASGVAMTGEISLRGKVLPVGGIREKLIGAARAGVKVVLLPEGNRRDLAGVPEEVKRAVDVMCVG